MNPTERFLVDVFRYGWSAFGLLALAVQVWNHSFLTPVLPTTPPFTLAFGAFIGLTMPGAALAFREASDRLLDILTRPREAGQ